MDVDEDDLSGLEEVEEIEEEEELASPTTAAAAARPTNSASQRYSLPPHPSAAATVASQRRLAMPPSSARAPSSSPMPSLEELGGALGGEEEEEQEPMDAATAAASGGAGEEEDEDGGEQEMQQQKSDGTSNAPDRSNTGSAAGSSTSANRGSLMNKSPPSSLSQIGLAMQLLLQSTSASVVLKPERIQELVKQCTTVPRDPKDTTTSTTKEKSTKDTSSTNDHTHTTTVYDHDEHLRTGPFHITADNYSSCATCLKHALIPAYSQKHHLQPQPMYLLDYSLKQQAFLAIIQARVNKHHEHTASATSSTSSEMSVLSQFILNYLGEPPSGLNALPAAPDTRFLQIFQAAMFQQSPFSIDLLSSEEQFYTRISSLCFAASNSNNSSTTSPIRETLLKFWLGRGSVRQSFDAINYLIRDCSKSDPLQLRSFVHEWREMMRARKNTILRVSQLTHLTEIGSKGRKVQLVCSNPPSRISPAVAQRRRGRAWNYESDRLGWKRLDNRICKILEAAYQAGQTHVEYSIEDGGYTYSADLVKMTQKNLQTGRQRPLRCLLALLIKEKGGKTSQTLEINMPHDTLIKELRQELGHYLHWDERLLRMSYGGKVLRRADYEPISIREGIIPLGSEPFTVTKLMPGETEELCSFTITGPTAVSQPLYECITCMGGLIMCSVCALQCHRGHTTRLITSDGGPTTGFCCCGSGGGSDLIPCKSLDSLPDDSETFYGPHMTISTASDYVYIISTEHGLMKIGTGTNSITGKLYGQNTQMSAHAGAQLACIRLPGADQREVILMRTPVVGSDILLHIDPETLFFTGHRTILAPGTLIGPTNADGIPLNCTTGAPSWCLEYCIKSEPESSDASDMGGMVDDNGEPLPMNVWTPVPTDLLTQLKAVLCTNWQYGHVSWLKRHDSSLMSVILEMDGMILRLPTKLGIKRCRIRVQHHEHIMPIFTRQDQLFIMQLTMPISGLGQQESSSSSRIRRHEYGLALDVYQMPTISTIDSTGVPYCRDCGGLMTTSSVSSVTVSPNVTALSFAAAIPFSTVPRFTCPNCHSSPSEFVDEEKQSSEPMSNSFIPLAPKATSMKSPTSSTREEAEPTVDETRMDFSNIAQQLQRRRSESGPSLPPSLPASPPANSVSYSSSAAMSATLPTPLPATSEPSPTPSTSSELKVELTGSEDLSVAQTLHMSPTFSPSPSASPMGLYDSTNLEDPLTGPPIGDGFLAQAWNQATLVPSPNTDEHTRPIIIHISRATSTRRIQLQAIIDMYKQMSTMTEATQMAKHVCDGCGSTGESVSLADGTISDSSRTLACLSVCLDRACDEEPVYLCKFCALMKHWNSKTHTAGHTMKRIETTRTADSMHPSCSSLYSSIFPSNYPHLHMGEFASYCDFTRGVLVLLRSVGSTHLAPTSTSPSCDSCLIYDLSTGVCTAKQVYLQTRSDCFVKDDINNAVWNFATQGSTLERWECIPEVGTSKDEQVASTINDDSIAAVDAAMVLLRELPILTSSVSVLTANIEQLIQLVEFVQGNSNIRQSHAQLLPLLLQQLRIQFVNWHVHNNSIHTANTEPAAMTSFNQITNKVVRSLESILHLSSPDRDRASIRSPARRTLFEQLSASIASSSTAPLESPWSIELQQLVGQIWVEGFELFYPTMKQRASIIGQLYDATMQSNLASTIAPFILKMLSEKYQQIHMGLKHVRLGTIHEHGIDSSICISTVQNHIHAWIELISESDMNQLTNSTGLTSFYQRPEQHVLSSFVSVYTTQVIQLLTHLNQTASSANDQSTTRPLRSVNRTCVKLATIIMQHVVELIDAAERQQSQWTSAHGPKFTSNTDPNLRLDHEAAVAEWILQFVKESVIGELFQFILLAIGEVQIEKLALSTSPIYHPHAQQYLADFLKAWIQVQCRLSKLNTAALKVTRIEQIAPISADQLTPNSTRARLGDTRRKLIALRESGQLLTLRTLQLSPNSTDLRGMSMRRSKSSSSSKQQPPYILTPAASEVFTELFFEFATTYQPIPAESLPPTNHPSASSGWNIGRIALSRADLANFFSKRGSTTHQSAMARALRECNKYSRTTIIVPISNQLPHIYGDSALFMSLQGFLTMMTDAAVESSRRVLRDLRTLELRHHFLNTHHPSLHMLPDMKVAFARVLNRLFSQAPSNAIGITSLATTSGMQLPLPSPSIPTQPSRTYSQVLLNRSIEEIVNIPPGSNKMSDSLAELVAANKAAKATVAKDSILLSNAFPQEVIMKLLNSQEAFNRFPTAAKMKLNFLSQFIIVPPITIRAALPVKSPATELTPMLLHEVYAEDVASSLVGESSTAKHGQLLLSHTAVAGSGDIHAFTDTLCTQRLSELFQRCMREVAPQGVGSIMIQLPDASIEPTAPKSLLATMAMLTGDHTPTSSHTPTGTESKSIGLSVANALFLCEKLFTCVLIKHNGLSDEYINYGRSLELYRLLSNTQTKNVRLMTSPTNPEWFRKVVRATARYVHTPILELIRVHQETVEKEEKKRLEQKANPKSSISERKEDQDESLTERKLNVQVDDLPDSTSTGNSPSTTAATDAKLSELLYRTLDRLISNAEFLLGSDLRTIMIGVGGGSGGGAFTPNRGASKPGSIKSSPMRPIGRSSRMHPSPEAATANLDDIQLGLKAEDISSDEDDDIRNAIGQDEDDDSSGTGTPSSTEGRSVNEGGGLLLRRVHSDLFSSPKRQANNASPHQVTQLELGGTAASSSGVKSHLLASPPTASTPTHSRRLSDSDINIQQLLLNTSLERPGTGQSESGGLSSWTSTSLKERKTPMGGDKESGGPMEEEQSQMGQTFESDWLARLTSSEYRLVDTIGAGIDWLTSTMHHRIKLLQLLNAIFQSGRTKELVDDVLEICRPIIADIQHSNSMRSNQDATQNALLFFYQHLAQLLSRLDWQQDDQETTTDSTRPPDLPPPLLQTRSSPSLRPSTSIYGMDIAPSNTTSLERQLLRQTSTRIRTILSIFSMEVTPNDSDLLLGSGLLSVLPRFIFRLHQQMMQHQQILHSQLYLADETPGPSPFQLSRSNTADNLATIKMGSSTIAPVQAPPSPSASSLWLTDEYVKLSGLAQNWSHQIFMYHCSSLLGLAPSKKTQQQRYVLASTLGRQLNFMIQAHIEQIQLAIVSGFPFHTNEPNSTDPRNEVSTSARIRSEDLSEFGSFPLQIGNPLQSGLRELDELIFRTVDMLNLLQRISSAEHSVCSRKHILFFLRALRTDDLGSGKHVILPSIIQMEMSKLLKRELTYHAPLAASPMVQSTQTNTTINSPMQPPGTPTRMGVFGPSRPSPTLSPSPTPPSSASLLRTPSLVVEDVAYSDVNLARELLDTVASMQAQQQLFHLAEYETKVELELPQPVQTESITPPEVMKDSDHKSPSPSAPLPLSPTASASSPHAATSTKEHARQSSFRRIGVLVCSSCQYIEFPACAHHKAFLTRQLYDGSAACPDEACSSNTGSSTKWARCNLCKKQKAELSFWLISEGEADYCASAIKNNQTPLINHNVFLCTICKVAEFPGTKTGGLTLNVDGKLFDRPTKKFLSTDLYKFTHFAPSCAGEVKLTPVRLSKEEATYLGRFLKRTPAIDLSIPLHSYGPGMGAVFKHDARPPSKSSNASLLGQSPIAVLGQLLGQPYAYQSWLPTPQGQSTVLMEMVNLMRNFLQLPPTREKERSADGHDANAFMARAVSSVDIQSSVSHSSALTVSGISSSLKVQWRDALMPLLKSAFYDMDEALHALANEQQPDEPILPSNIQRALYSLLSLQVLGGLSESIHNGSKVEVWVDNSAITGVVQHYDPTLSTVSVAVKRPVPQDVTTAEKSALTDSSPSIDREVAPILATLGLTHEVGAGYHSVFEFPLDQVKPISPSQPPPISVLGQVSDFLHHASNVLLMKASTKQMEDESMKFMALQDEKRDDKESEPSITHSIYELLLLQTQHHLLLVLLHYLPHWLHVASDLSTEVLDLLSVCVNRWNLSPLSTSLCLHPYEWSEVASVTFQQLTQGAAKMVQDEHYARRKRLAVQLVSPESQPETNKLPTPPTTVSASAAKSAAQPFKRVSSVGSMNTPYVIHANSSDEDEDVRVSVDLVPYGVSSSSSGASSSSSGMMIPVTMSPALPPQMPPILQHLDSLISMGFPSHVCRYALASTRGNVESSAASILEGRINEDVDENRANAAFESLIDRMGQRSAVEQYRAYQEHQAIQQARRQAEAIVGANAPQAPPLAGSSTHVRATTETNSKALNNNGLSDSERRLLTVAPHIQMANRYAYSNDAPLDVIALSTPVDNATATSRVLNTSSTKTQTTDYALDQDRLYLFERAKSGTLIGSELFIPPDAFAGWSTVRGKRFPYKVGDTLTIIDLVSKVCAAEVDDINEETNKIFIHYTNWCMDPRTEVVLATGEIIPLTQLESHHQLLSDDGRTHVSILPKTLDKSQRGRMVKLVPASKQFETIIVTENHILTLIAPHSCRIQQRQDGWFVTQINSINNQLSIVEVGSSFLTEVDATSFARELDQIRWNDPPRYDISIEDYLKLSDEVRSGLMMFRPPPTQPQLFHDGLQRQHWTRVISQTVARLRTQTLAAQVLSIIGDQLAWLWGYSSFGFDSSIRKDLAAIIQLQQTFQCPIQTVLSALIESMETFDWCTELLLLEPSTRRHLLSGLIDHFGEYDSVDHCFKLDFSDELISRWSYVISDAQSFTSWSQRLGNQLGLSVTIESTHSLRIAGLPHHLQSLPVHATEKQYDAKEPSDVRTYPYGSTFTISPIAPNEAFDPNSSLDDQPYVSFSVSGNERYLLANGLVVHNSKKWDEWVDINSPRIQPKFVVGDRITLKDTVGKVAEGNVMEVEIKENQLRIFVHYIGWGSKWDEWLPATSNRILVRHESGNKKDKSSDPYAHLQKALGLSTQDNIRLPQCPIDITNRVGTVECVDLLVGSGDDDSNGPLVLMKVTDESLNASLMVWLQLAQLRSVQPLPHQLPCHIAPLPPKPTRFNLATLRALHPTTQQLLQLTVDAQEKNLAIMAKRIVQTAVSLLTNTTQSAVDTHAPTPTTDASQHDATLPISPISPLSPLLHQPDTLSVITQLLQHMKLQDILPLLCHPLTPNGLTSILQFSQAELISHTGSKIHTDRTRLVAMVAQLILARWYMELLNIPTRHGAETPTQDSDDHSTGSTLSFEDDLFQLIESCSQSIIHTATKLQLHQLTSVAPGQSLTIGLNSTNSSSTDSNSKDEPTEDDTLTTPFNLQLVSTILDPILLSEGVVPKFSKELIWTIRFFADPNHTVLLKEMHVTGDPQTRTIPPFAVSNPVYITSSTSQRSIAKSKDDAKSTKSVKFASSDDLPVNFSITPLFHEHLELMTIISEAVIHIRRMQIAGGQLTLPTRSTASFNFSTNTPSSNFLRTLLTSTSLATTLDHFLSVLYEGLKDFIEVFTAMIPIPSNPKIRAYECMTQILEITILTNKSKRDALGALTQTTKADRSTTPNSSSDNDRATAHAEEMLASMQDEELDVCWMIDTIISEAKSRLVSERQGINVVGERQGHHNSSIYSVYLQHLLSLLLVGIRYEFMVASHEAIDIGDDLLGSAAIPDGQLYGPLISDGQLRTIIQKELPVVLSMEQLILHSTDAAAHPPQLTDADGNVKDCSCSWCQELSDIREHAQLASTLMDFSPSSIIGTMIYDLDYYPDLRDVETGLRRTQLVTRRNNNMRISPTAMDPMNASSSSSKPDRPTTFTAIFNAFNSATNLFRSEAQLTEQQQNLERMRQGMDLTGSETASSSSSSSSLVSASGSSSINSLSPVDWRFTLSICDRVLSSSSLRTRLLHLLLNGTAAPNVPRPEIAFRRGADVEEMTSITQAKHLYRSLPHTHPIQSTKQQRKKLFGVDDDASLDRGNMFQQLVDGFIKANLHTKSIALRAELGAVTFKCVLSGALDAGAAGLPGPFRQALAEISSFLNAQALDSASIDSGSSLFIPTPNSRSQTGDDRNKLLLNPSLLQKGEISLVQCRIFGQLIAIAIRSKNCLNMDLSSVLWKQLLEIPLVPEDLQSFDYTASKSLQFIDPMNDLPFTQDEFDEYLGYLTWTTVLSDGTTQIELKPGGATQKVHFHQRHQYAAKAIEARLQESSLLVTAIREGLLSVIPKQCLHFLSWRELELRVCGRPTIDLSVLERHTVYSPSTFTRQTPIITWFWQILSEFTQDELGQFLQFCWARSRLPADDQPNSYRMQLNILDAAPKSSSSFTNATDSQTSPNDQLLPTSETCFFNVNMPKYSNLETMRAKIKMALLCSTITS